MKSESAQRSLEHSLPRRPVDAGPAALLDAIRVLSPEIVTRSQEIEAARTLPPDLFDKLRATGVFRMIQARELGGGEYRLPDVLPIIEEIARCDGSTAWNVLIGTEVSAIWQHFDRSVIRSIVSTNPDAMTRGALTPRGTVTPTERGFVLKGRWQLGSGAYEHDWFLLGAIATGGATSNGAAASPELRICAVPAVNARIIDTWDAIGLRSTMSNDVEVKEAFVPKTHCIPMPWTESDGTTLGRVPMWLVLGPFHCAMVLGVARAAIDDLSALVRTKRPLFNPTLRMAEDPLVQYRIGNLEIRLAAARSLILAESEAVWSHAEVGGTFSPIDRARARSITAFVHAECMEIANEVYGLAGSNVLYNTSSLQRRFRDMRAACQHIIGSTEIYRPFGSLLLGETPPEMLVSL